MTWIDFVVSFRCSLLHSLVVGGEGEWRAVIWQLVFAADFSTLNMSLLWVLVSGGAS